MTTMNVSDTCNAAADLIEVRGWTFGVGWNPTSDADPLCLEGAIAAAAGIEQPVNIAVKKCGAWKAVPDHLGRVPWIWNDELPYRQYGGGNPHPNHSPESIAWAREQVIATLRAVAVIHAARENESVETGAVERIEVSA